MNVLEAVEALYEARPYPALGFFASLTPLRRDDLPLLNYQAGYCSSFGSSAGAARNPRILVAGCGTFEPVAVAAANPGAEILAVDISAKALGRLKRQLRWRGLTGRVRLLQSDLCRIPKSEGRFDFIVATGVLHHLEQPALALESLLARAHPRAVLRLMVYSPAGRDLLYGAKALAGLLGANTPRQVRRMMGALPADHPYRIYFHLYDDARTDSGLADGYLHPWDQPRSALGMEELLAQVGLVASKFLHRPGGQPEAAAALAPAASDWERMAVLEALGSLEENFKFFARRQGEEPQGHEGDHWFWNPALGKRGQIHSHLLGRDLAFDRSCRPAQLAPGERADLVKALLLLKGDC